MAYSVKVVWFILTRFLIVLVLLFIIGIKLVLSLTIDTIKLFGNMLESLIHWVRGISLLANNVLEVFIFMERIIDNLGKSTAHPPVQNSGYDW